jgi:hypothetical protein
MIRWPAGKKLNDSVLKARQVALAKRESIEIVDGNKVILTISAHGDVAEVPAPRMKANFRDLIAHAMLDHGRATREATLRLARWIQMHRGRTTKKEAA